MNIVLFILGIALLALGRRLFWLSVAVIGFVAGYILAGQFFSESGELLRLVIGLVAGLIGAGLAVFLQSIAVAIAGFLGGGFVAVQLIAMLGPGGGEIFWVPFIIGGILGLVLILVLFDWALIVLSSLVGASLVTQSIGSDLPYANLVFFLLLLAGIAVQAALKRREGG